MMGWLMSGTEPFLILILKKQSLKFEVPNWHLHFSFVKIPIKIVTVEVNQLPELFTQFVERAIFLPQQESAWNAAHSTVTCQEVLDFLIS